MRIRELPPMEWEKVAGTEMGDLCDLLTARRATAHILMAEDDDGRVIGHFGLFSAWHAEAMWIDPAYRRQGAVMRGLLSEMQRIAQRLGLRGVVTAAMDPIVEEYLGRLGASRLPGVALVWPLPQKDVACLSLSSLP